LEIYLEDDKLIIKGYRQKPIFKENLVLQFFEDKIKKIAGYITALTV